MPDAEEIRAEIERLREEAGLEEEMASQHERKAQSLRFHANRLARNLAAALTQGSSHDDR